MDDPRLHLFTTEFIRLYRDVGYYVLSAIYTLALNIPLAKEHKLKPEEEHGFIAKNILKLLMVVDIANTSEELREGGTYLLPPSVLVVNPTSNIR